MTKKNNRNNKQDTNIAVLWAEFKNLKERFDKFLDNEFEHLKSKVDKIMWVIVIGFLVSILTALIIKFL